MPIYGFECDSCGHRFDRLQKLSDTDPTVCPNCGAETLRRQLTAPSFRLSGSGWYETDFKKDGDKKRNLTEKGESAAAGSKPESAGGNVKPVSPESKPAASSDTATAKPVAASNSKAGQPDPKPVPKPASE